MCVCVPVELETALVYFSASMFLMVLIVILIPVIYVTQENQATSV